MSDQAKSGVPFNRLHKQSGQAVVTLADRYGGCHDVFLGKFDTKQSKAQYPQAAAQLLPLVYAELRQLAAQKLANEKPGQTLDATALVHEAYLRQVGATDPARFSDRNCREL